jgi:predicted urease superfamily metal-dependent hydrolase
VTFSGRVSSPSGTSEGEGRPFLLLTYSFWRKKKSEWTKGTWFRKAMDGVVKTTSVMNVELSPLLAVIGGQPSVKNIFEKIFTLSFTPPYPRAF